MIQSAKDDLKEGSELHLTKEEAFAVSDFIDLHLIQAIREDDDIDSMLWLRDMMNAYEKLAVYGGYEGMTFPSKPKEEGPDR